MRYSRMLFALPVMMIMAAFTYLAAPVSLGSPPTAHEVAYTLHDVTITPDAAHVAALQDERADLSRPGDAHAVEYPRANQPLTKWRFAVEAYSRIDPHIEAAWALR